MEGRAGRRPQALDAGTLRSAVVLAFGTNAGLESDESQQALRAVLDALGPSRRVVLVNTVGVSDWVPSSNATLAAISAEYPNTIVMDWHSDVAATQACCTAIGHTPTSTASRCTPT